MPRRAENIYFALLHIIFFASGSLGGVKNKHRAVLMSKLCDFEHRRFYSKGVRRACNRHRFCIIAHFVLKICKSLFFIMQIDLCNRKGSFTPKLHIIKRAQNRVVLKVGYYAVAAEGSAFYCNIKRFCAVLCENNVFKL